MSSFQIDSRCGCLPRESFAGPVCAPAHTMDLIPWDAIPDMLVDQERNKSSLYHVWKDSKIGVLNQGPLSYCWAFASVTALMFEREQEGLPYVPLSPSSIAAPILGYQDSGGYIETALDWMIKKGVASEAYVPQTTTRRDKFKVGWQNDALMHKVSMWEDIGGSFQAQLTASLQEKPRPAPCVYNWWRHAIFSLRFRDVNPRLKPNDPNRFERDMLQSYGPNEGDGGVIVLKGSEQIANASYMIKQASFVG